MRWRKIKSTDQYGRAIADRHYNRQNIGSYRFMPPGRCYCLLTLDNKALWGTSWPYAEYVLHAWAGAWVNSVFRNEGAGLSSELIREAIAATRTYWEPPELGIITFVDQGAVKKKKDFGYCYLKAGFRHVGFTKGGLVALQMLPSEMPEPCEPIKKRYINGIVS